MPIPTPTVAAALMTWLNAVTPEDRHHLAHDLLRALPANAIRNAIAELEGGLSAAEQDPQQRTSRTRLPSIPENGKWPLQGMSFVA